jgi:hypothetical protein
MFLCSTVPFKGTGNCNNEINGKNYQITAHTISSVRSQSNITLPYKHNWNVSLNSGGGCQNAFQKYFRYSETSVRSSNYDHFSKIPHFFLWSLKVQGTPLTACNTVTGYVMCQYTYGLHLPLIVSCYPVWGLGSVLEKCIWVDRNVQERLDKCDWCRALWMHLNINSIKKL